MVKSENFQAAFYEAECFLEVSKLIKAQTFSNKPLTSRKVAKRNTYLNFAQYVNHAYAFELYLKCLMIIEQGVYYAGHNLSFLFEKLSPVTQTNIVTYYHSKYQHVRRDATKSGGVAEPDFHELLEEAKNAFVEFRYLFEKKSVRPYVLAGIVESVRFEILKLKPELENLW